MSERFYSHHPLSLMQQVELDPTQSHHLLHVMRATIGQSVRLFDGSPQEFLAVITAKDRRVVRLEVMQALHAPQLAAPRLVVAAPIPKGERFRFLVEKLTELGVAAYVPLLCQRSVNPFTASLEKKAEQWVIEACKQSGRNSLMALAPACLLADWLTSIEDVPERILAGVPGEPQGEPRSMSDPAPQVPPIPESQGSSADPQAGDAPAATKAVLAVGPEGGFTPGEIQTILDRGFQTCVIGQHVLRVETAAVAGAALWISRARGDSCPPVRSTTADP
jgi:16S rRNA (uracil1498-N3)-methyltransferase